MAFKLKLPFASGSSPSPTTTSGPLDQLLGHTPPKPDIESMPQPRAGGLPYGASGRANFAGLLELAELNRTLVGIEGLRRFDEMYRTDAHIRRLVLMAWAPILGGNWSLEPYGGDGATDQDRLAAEVCWWALTKYMSPNWIEHLDTLGPVLLRSGYCPFEQLWGTCDYKGKTYTMPRKLDLRLPKSVWRWWQDDFGEMTHISQILPNRADVVIPATELVYYRLAPEGDNWVGTSLLRHAYKPWYLKDKLERIDAIGQERKAVGVPIIYPPKGADPATKQEVEQLFASMHMSEVAYAMMPGPKAGSQGPTGVPQDEWLVEVIQFDSSSGEGIQASLAYHQRAIESSFAQDFMALGQHQVGARATAEVQEDPYLAAVEALAKSSIVPAAQRLIDRMADVNWGDTLEGPPELTCSLTESASMSEIAAYLQQLVLAEIVTPDPDLEDWVREHADMPPADPATRAAKQKAVMQGLATAALPPSAPLDESGQAVPQKPATGGPPMGASKPTAPAAAAPFGQKASGPAGKSSAKPGAAKPGAGKKPNPKKPATAGRQLAQSEPTARWFEALLSKNELQTAFDGCRQHIEDAVGPAARHAAQELAYPTAEGVRNPDAPAPAGLVDALTGHYQDLYRLGAQTVAIELDQQRQKLSRTLERPTIPAAGAGAGGSRWARARARGEHSARNIQAAIQARLGRDQIAALKDAAALQAVAETAAINALHLEALTNAAAMVNDGRADQAVATDGVVGGYYTSVLDERTCGECEKADDGTLLTVEDALAYGPPNPLCEGSHFCRCAIVYVMSGDPAAFLAQV